MSAVPQKSPAVLAMVLVATLSACASSRSRGSDSFANEGYREHQRTNGSVDEPFVNSSGAPFAPAPALSPPAEASRTESLAVASSSPGVAGVPGAAEALFEFADGIFGSDKVSGDLGKGQPMAQPEPAAPSTGPQVPAAGGDKPPMESSAATRLVIYQGSLVVLVPVVEAAIEKLSARNVALGGYVQNQSGNSSANNGTVTLRVPAESFYALVNELGSYGQVTQKNVTANDVTKTVFDIELRMETAERSRLRLLDLLKSATKMEEIIQIEGEVRRLTTEIEAMKGELRFLKDQVAFSTLAVTFYSHAPPPNTSPSRTRSRFDWINQVGIENVLYNF